MYEVSTHCIYASAHGFGISLRHLHTHSTMICVHTTCILEYKCNMVRGYNVHSLGTYCLTLHGRVRWGWMVRLMFFFLFSFFFFLSSFLSLFFSLFFFFFFSLFFLYFSSLFIFSPPAAPSRPRDRHRAATTPAADAGRSCAPGREGPGEG